MMDFSALNDYGLILFSAIRGQIEGSISLRREVARGKLVALRRGAFVETEIWALLSSREKHLLRARAVLAASDRPLALCGISAAAAWGMPIAGDWPVEVSVLDEWKGGGRSEPGVRSTASGFATARIETIAGLPVTDLARTAVDVARLYSFADAVSSVDWALWRRNERAVTQAELLEEVGRLAPRTGRFHLAQVAAFATPLSDSFGESRGRASIHLLGFSAPELQVEFRDAQGLISPDYYWREVRQAAEFDGKSKYTRDEFTGGDPGEVVWREKKREDRLRKLVAGVTRILTVDVANPARLARLLGEAGIPRTNSGSPPRARARARAGAGARGTGHQGHR